MNIEHVNYVELSGNSLLKLHLMTDKDTGDITIMKCQ